MSEEYHPTYRHIGKINIVGVSCATCGIPFMGGDKDVKAIQVEDWNGKILSRSPWSHDVCPDLDAEMEELVILDMLTFRPGSVED